MSATDSETATCSSRMLHSSINPLHNDPIILSAADTTDSMKVYHLAEEATSTDKDTIGHRLEA